MKCVYLYFSVFLLMNSAVVKAQEEEHELPESIQQQLENEAYTTDLPMADDAYWQHLDYLRRHQLNLNEANQQDLMELQLLSAWQIEQFLRYRSLFGPLLSVYELQVIPGWDLSTIRKILPLVTVVQRPRLFENLWQRFRGGDQQLLFRFTPARSGNTSDPTDTVSKELFAPSPYFLFRYRYNYKNRLQFGITAEKDAGELFFKGAQRMGFDFYGVHFFAKQLGIIKALALGDFTVNLGQGLIHWQSFAFKKSAAVLQIKRQSAVLRPYQSAGEFNFHRGIGVTLQQGSWELTLFGSRRLFSARLKTDSAITAHPFITSLNASGYHRSITEQANKNNVLAIMAGGNLRYHFRNGHWGVNAIHYRFSLPFGLSDKPYDLFAITGRQWMNYSIDGSFTFHNAHLFGEVAFDRQHNMALLGGLLLSLDPKAALSMVYRRVSKKYQALFANAFTEQTMPGNEYGLYTGMELRFSPMWQLTAYADLYRFPWLRYRADAPSAGNDYLVQVTYHPHKKVTVLGRFRSENKPQNDDAAGMPVHAVLPVKRCSFRGQLSFQVNQKLLLQERMEWLRVEVPGRKVEKGFSVYIEGSYHWAPRCKAGLRLVQFDTDSYDARIYAFEQGIQFNTAVPAFYGKGTRYNMYVQFDPVILLNRRKRPSIHCKVQIRVAGFLHRKGLADDITVQQTAETGVQLILSR